MAIPTNTPLPPPKLAYRRSASVASSPPVTPSPALYSQNQIQQNQQDKSPSPRGVSVAPSESPMDQYTSTSLSYSSQLLNPPLYPPGVSATFSQPSGFSNQSYNSVQGSAHTTTSSTIDAQYSIPAPSLLSLAPRTPSPSNDGGTLSQWGMKVRLSDLSMFEPGRSSPPPNPPASALAPTSISSPPSVNSPDMIQNRNFNILPTTWNIYPDELSIPNDASPLVATSVSKDQQTIKAEWKNGNLGGSGSMMVSVRRVKCSSQSSGKELREWMDRTRPLLETPHECLVPFLGHSPFDDFEGVGVKEDVGLGLYVVMPWYENGDILGWLQKNGNAKRTQFMEEAAVGLEFLHSKNITHGRIRPSQLLITPKLHCQISDFSFYSFPPFSTSSSTTDNQYVSPEAWKGRIGKPADVFSLAMTYYATLIGGTPWGFLPENQVYTLVVREGERPDKPDGEGESKFWPLLTSMWKPQGNDRLSMSDVVYWFQSGAVDNNTIVGGGRIRQSADQAYGIPPAYYDFEDGALQSPVTSSSPTSTEQVQGLRVDSRVRSLPQPPISMSSATSDSAYPTPTSANSAGLPNLGYNSLSIGNTAATSISLFPGVGAVVPFTSENADFEPPTSAFSVPSNSPSSMQSFTGFPEPTGNPVSSNNHNWGMPTGGPRSSYQPSISSISSGGAQGNYSRVAQRLPSIAESKARQGSNLLPTTFIQVGSNAQESVPSSSSAGSFRSQSPSSVFQRPQALPTRSFSTKMVPTITSGSTNDRMETSRDWDDLKSVSSGGNPSAVIVVGALQAEIQDGRKHDIIDGHLFTVQELIQASDKNTQKMVTAGIIPLLITLLNIRAVDGSGLEIVLRTLGLLSNDRLTANSIYRGKTPAVLLEIAKLSTVEIAKTLAIWCLSRLCRTAETALGLMQLGIINTLVNKGLGGYSSTSQAAAWCIGNLVFNDAIADTLVTQRVLQPLVDNLRRNLTADPPQADGVCAALYSIARISRSIKIAKQLHKLGAIEGIVHCLNTSDSPEVLGWAARAVGCLMRPNSSDMSKALLDAGAAKGLARLPRVLPTEEVAPLESFAFTIQRFCAAEWGGGTRKALVDAGCVDSLLAALRTSADVPVPSVHKELALAISFLGDVGGGELRKEIARAGGVDILKKVGASGDKEVAKACNIAVTTMTGNIFTRNTASAKTAMAHNWSGGCDIYFSACPIVFVPQNV